MVSYKTAGFTVRSKKLVAFTVLVGVFFISNALLASRPMLSWYGLSKVLEYTFLILYLARTVREKFQLEHIALLFSCSALFESLLAISQYIHQGSLNGIFYFFGERMFSGVTPGIANASIAGDLILRPYGTFPHPNVLAGYLLISLLFVWFFLRKSVSNWLQLLSAVSLIVISIALLLTLSRIAIAIWVVFVIVLLLKHMNLKLRNTKQKVIAGLLLIVALGIVFMSPISHELVARFSQTSFTEESFTERTVLTSAAFTLFQQHPLLGVGLDNFLPSLAPLQTPMPLNLYLQPVHNIFLLVATELGFIGFFLFLELLFASAQEILHKQKEVRNFLFLALGIIIITGMFDHYWLTLQQGQLLFATIFGLSWIKIEKS